MVNRRIRNIFVSLLILVLVAIVSGCASTTQFVPFPDQAKRLDDSNKTRIYVVRPTSFGANRWDEGERWWETNR